LGISESCTGKRSFDGTVTTGYGKRSCRKPEDQGLACKIAAIGLTPCVGRYDWGQIHNDAISSLRVPAGMRVTLYTDTHFQGGSKTFTQDTPYVGDDFNDRTSSIQVESGTAGTPHAPTGGVVVVYDDSQYRGYRQELGAGSYGWGQIHNDTISSLRVPAGMSVTLYTDTHFQGRSKTFTKDTPYVGDDFNDQTSSIVVRG
jgi:hypothetical protein